MQCRGIFFPTPSPSSRRAHGCRRSPECGCINRRIMKPYDSFHLTDATILYTQNANGGIGERKIRSTKKYLGNPSARLITSLFSAFCLISLDREPQPPFPTPPWHPRQSSIGYVNPETVMPPGGFLASGLGQLFFSARSVQCLRGGIFSCSLPGGISVSHLSLFWRFANVINSTYDPNRELNLTARLSFIRKPTTNQPPIILSSPPQPTSLSKHKSSFFFFFKVSSRSPFFATTK